MYMYICIYVYIYTHVTERDETTQHVTTTACNACNHRKKRKSSPL